MSLIIGREGRFSSSRCLKIGSQSTGLSVNPLEKEMERAFRDGMAGVVSALLRWRCAGVSV